jgi:uncharacterized protein (DUF362 family)
VNDTWDRRHFLKRVGVAGAGAAGSVAVGLLAKDDGVDPANGRAPVERIPDFTKGVGSGRTSPAIGRGDPADAVVEAITLLGGMSRFVKTGETVVIKPNVAWDRTPIQAANTNPIVVATLVELCLKAGARRVVVTDNTCNDARRCFTRSGIWKAVERAGGEVVLPDEHRFGVRDLGGVIGRVPVLLPVVEADRFINAAIAKHHSLAGFTGAMKNLYGVIGGRRNRHHQRIHDSIVDLTTAIRATLSVIDATRVLFRNGPQGGDISDTKTIGQVIAATDPVALDAYACTLIGLKPSDLSYLVMGERQGLGHIDAALSGETT